MMTGTGLSDTENWSHCIIILIKNIIIKLKITFCITILELYYTML